eukprot:5723877-Pleurochrysis_carterae.AAC.4
MAPMQSQSYLAIASLVRSHTREMLASGNRVDEDELKEPNRHSRTTTARKSRMERSSNQKGKLGQSGKEQQLIIR